MFLGKKVREDCDAYILVLTNKLGFLTVDAVVSSNISLIG